MIVKGIHKLILMQSKSKKLSKSVKFEGYETHLEKSITNIIAWYDKSWKAIRNSYLVRQNFQSAPCCGNALESSRRGVSNKYQQCKFLWRNMYFHR